MSGVISQSFTTAGTTMVGQNLGARKYARANHILFVILAFSLGLSTLTTLVMVFWPDAIYGRFTTDIDVLSLASILTLPVIANFFGAATRSVSFSLINGSGQARLNLAVAMINGVVGRIGLAALLGFATKLDCLGFWMGDVLTGFMPLVIGLIFYFFRKWRGDPKRSIIDGI